MLPAPMTPPLFTLDEFERFLATQEEKYELIDGVIRPMGLVTVAHDILIGRMFIALTAKSAPPCRTYTSNMGVVRADAPTYLYPDVSVSCESVERTTTRLYAPKFVLEVISPESVERDTFEKPAQYVRIGSIEELLVLDSRTVLARLHIRRNGWWYVIEHRAGAVFELTSLPGVVIDVDALYADLGD